jgi:hypothetical protein
MKNVTGNPEVITRRSAIPRRYEIAAQTKLTPIMSQPYPKKKWMKERKTPYPETRIKLSKRNILTILVHSRENAGYPPIRSKENMFRNA